jgi:hypothetical protein
MIVLRGILGVAARAGSHLVIAKQSTLICPPALVMPVFVPPSQ